ncbi:MAG: hypothetical protein EA385_01350, partial [Salinarimonadaceae bacterium]
MPDVSSTSRAEIETTLTSLVSSGAFPELGRPGAAALLWIADPLRLVWASPAAAHIAAALVLDGAGAVSSSFPAGERLAALVGGLAPRDRNRLEKLRFESSAFAPLSTCLCRLVTLPDGIDALVTIFVDGLPRLRVQPRAAQPPAAEPVSTGSADDQRAHDPEAGDPSAPQSAPPPAPEPTPEPTPEPKAEPKPEPEPEPAPASTIRFVWEAGADGRITRVTEGLAEAVGPLAADVVGRSFAELLQERVHDPKDIVAELLARGETFSGRTLHWRVAGGDEAVPIDLAGLPVRDRDRAVVGYRGFGLCRPQHRLPWAPTPPAPEPADANRAPESGAAPIPSGSVDPLAMIAPLQEAAPDSAQEIDREPTEDIAEQEFQETAQEAARVRSEGRSPELAEEISEGGPREFAPEANSGSFAEASGQDADEDA